MTNGTSGTFGCRLEDCLDRGGGAAPGGLVECVARPEGLPRGDPALGSVCAMCFADERV